MEKQQLNGKNHPKVQYIVSLGTMSLLRHAFQLQLFLTKILLLFKVPGILRKKYQNLIRSKMNKSYKAKKV